MFGPLTTDKGLDFAINIGPGAPAELVTDNQRLRQILHNLLSNAVKFTDTGGVELRIGPAEANAGDPAPGLAFSVSDTGIGISADNLETIFGAFQQGDGTTSRRYGGTGLGLAICRELAAQLGGLITARSAPGKGSTFTLRLPLTCGQRRGGERHRAGSRGHHPAGGRRRGPRRPGRQEGAHRRRRPAQRLRDHVASWSSTG